MLENSILVPVPGQASWFPGRSRFLGQDASGLAVVMSLDRQTLGPCTFPMEELVQAIADHILQIEPSDKGALLPEDLSTKARAEYDFWRPHFLSLLEGESRDALLEGPFRVTAQAALVKVTGKPAITVRRWFNRMLRAGRSLLGLCPNFRGRGGPGRPQRKDTAKRGRKPLPGSITSHAALPDVRPIMEAAVLNHVIKLKAPVDSAFYKMIAESFTRTTTHPNGVVKTTPYEESQLPTLAQFRRVADQVQAQASPVSRIARRARPGTAKEGVPGPGYRYEIDATGGRLELVSEFDLSQSIGPANAYGVLDVSTTVCVGGVMGVFNAGYRAAQVGLFNTFTSKKDLCARWDIDIPEEAWPCAHVCRYLTSDRGELVSDASEALPAELNVIAQTAPPYRPDMKGTVEGWFSHLKAGDIRHLVGFGRKENRGERDPKDQAALTRYDAMRAFLLLALKYNHQPAPQSAIPPEMLEEGYETISRITLWQWGMNNRVTGARQEDPGLIYTSLLQKVDAKIRENGLFVRDVPYMSPELRASGLLQRAAQYGAIDVQATLDDFAARTVWYRTDLDAPWLPAYLADEKLKLYDATFEELAAYYRRSRVVRQRTRIQSAVFDKAMGDEVKVISADAVIRQGAAGAKGSKKKSNVRAARAVDAESERREHGAQVMGSYRTAAQPKPRTSAGATPPNAIAASRLNLARTAFLKPGS